MFTNFPFSNIIRTNRIFCARKPSCCVHLIQVIMRLFAGLAEGYCSHGVHIRGPDGMLYYTLFHVNKVRIVS